MGEKVKMLPDLVLRWLCVSNVAPTGHAVADRGRRPVSESRISSKRQRGTDRSGGGRSAAPPSVRVAY